MTEQKAEIKKTQAKARRGWETTEFWLVLALAVGSMILNGVGRIDAPTMLKVMGAGVSFYAMARGMAKR